MDQELPDKAEIALLIHRSAQARDCLEIEAVRIKKRFDIQAKLRQSLSAHPASWLVGSLSSGLAASLLLTPRRRRHAEKSKKQRGISRMLLGLALTTARPLAKVWLSKQVAQWLQPHRNPQAARPAMIKPYQKPIP
jgi:hypothetical protein